MIRLLQISLFSRMPAELDRMLARLGSLHFTLFALSSTILGVAALLWIQGQATRVLLLPMSLLTLNLAAAIMTNRTFRRQPYLLVFHLALLMLVLLAVAGRMTYMKGWVEVSEQAEFDGVLDGYEAGPWHPWHLQQARFVNQGFDIYYSEGPRRDETLNRVGWQDDSGNRHVSVIGDKEPLVRQGYRFYTSFNKGFAPVFTWLSGDAEVPVTGDLHLPSFPANRHRQTIEWTPPGSAGTLWFLLLFDEVILDPDRPSRFRPPQQHRMVVRLGENRHLLKPGQTVEIAGGRLTYHGLRSWMGYKVSYDWTRPWLLAASLIAVASLALHLRRKFGTGAWMQ